MSRKSEGDEWIRTMDDPKTEFLNKLGFFERIKEYNKKREMWDHNIVVKYSGQYYVVEIFWKNGWRTNIKEVEDIVTLEEK